MAKHTSISAKKKEQIQAIETTDDQFSNTTESIDNRLALITEKSVFRISKFLYRLHIVIRPADVKPVAAE